MPSIEVPTVANCKKQYTCTLSGTAEVRGDHIATLVLPEYLSGEWKLPSSDTWVAFKTQSFLFTSAGETYDLRFYTWTLTADGPQLNVPYTVTAIYAPAWAKVQSIITATRTYEPCCGVGDAPTSGFSTVYENLASSHRSTATGFNAPPCTWTVNNQYIGAGSGPSSTATSSGSSLVGYNVPTVQLTYSFPELSGTITASVTKVNGNVTLTQSNTPTSASGFTCEVTGGATIVTSSPICVGTDLGARVWVRLRARVQLIKGPAVGGCFSQSCSPGTTNGTQIDSTVHEIRLESAAAP